MQIHVRTATPADAEILAGFNRAHAAEVEGMTLDPATVRAGVAAALADPAKGTYLLAEAEGQPVGCLLLTTEWSDWRNRWVWWIQSVYVQASYRGQGVYTALHRAVEERAQASGVGLLRLYVYEGNATARRQYERLGMQGGHYLVYEQPLA